MLTLKLFHSNEEDYRWVVLRKKIPPWLFQVTNLVFIGTSPQHKLHPALC